MKTCHIYVAFSEWLRWWTLRCIFNLKLFPCGALKRFLPCVALLVACRLWGANKTFRTCLAFVGAFPLCECSDGKYEERSLNTQDTLRVWILRTKANCPHRGCSLQSGPWGPSWRGRGWGLLPRAFPALRAWVLGGQCLPFLRQNRICFLTKIFTTGFLGRRGFSDAVPILGATESLFHACCGCRAASLRGRSCAETGGSAGGSCCRTWHTYKASRPCGFSGAFSGWLCDGKSSHSHHMYTFPPLNVLSDGKQDRNCHWNFGHIEDTRMHFWLLPWEIQEFQKVLWFLKIERVLSMGYDFQW